MTTNDLILALKSDFSRPNDALLDAVIVTKLGEVQQRLEEQPFLPWFLAFSATAQNLAGVSTVDFSGLTGFIRLVEEAELSVVDPSALSGNENEKFLVRDDSYQLLVSRGLGTAADAATTPSFYHVLGFTATLRPKVFVGAQFTFNVRYYRHDPTLPVVGNSTLWTTNAGQYLKAEAGVELAKRLRDPTRLADYKLDVMREKANLIRRHQAQMDVQMEYVMGGRD